MALGFGDGGMASKFHDAVKGYSVKGKICKASVSDIVNGPTARSVLAIRNIKLFGYSAEKFSEVFIGFGQYVDLAT